MSVDVRPAEIDLPAGFKGTAIRPGDAQYDAARAVYNGGIDRRPDLIVRPASAADIRDALAFARQQNLPVAVRGGGHSVAGVSAVERGVLIDLSSLKGIHVDPERGTARANAGVLWGEYDRETEMFGLATPGGRVTTTGIGGFCLGGGYGWLSPKFGLTCDNLVSADLLTANGRLMHVSDETNPELMWALRGAGANFGVVTSFEFRVHPMPPLILAGMLVVPNDERAGTVVRGYRDYVEQAPEDLVTALVTLLAPPADFVPAELVGRPVLTIVAASFVDDLAEGERLIAPLRQLTEDGTAACNRAATYMAHPIACWQHPVETDREMKWVARFSAAFEPVLAGGVYLNFEPETQEAVVRAGFGDDKYERLAALKEQYDPENVFRGNHNVVPRTSSVIHPRSGDGGSRVT